MTWDFQQYSMCDQQSLRPACAYAQSDQSLYLSLAYSLNVQLLTEHHLEFLRLKGGCTGSSESTLVKIPHCWKSHVAVHISVDRDGRFDGPRLYNGQVFWHLWNRIKQYNITPIQQFSLEGWGRSSSISEESRNIVSDRS